MGFRNKMKAMQNKNIYAKPWMLPESIAFTVMSVDRIPVKSADPPKLSNVLYLKYKPDLVIQFYGDSEFQKFEQSDIDDYNDALKSGKWYVVSYG